MSDLTKTFLGEDLTELERMYLKSLSMHDGFPVLKKIFDQACRIATEESLKADPEKDDYDRVVKYRQMRARIINEFCGAIIKSFNANVSLIQEKDNERPASRNTAA